MKKSPHKPIREFKGTRDECHDFLLNNGFRFERGQLLHDKFVGIVTYENHGDWLGEVTDWNQPRFIAKIWKAGQ